jgi:hypothetical protein
VPFDIAKAQNSNKKKNRNVYMDEHRMTCFKASARRNSKYEIALCIRLAPFLKLDSGAEVWGGVRCDGFLATSTQLSKQRASFKTTLNFMARNRSWRGKFLLFYYCSMSVKNQLRATKQLVAHPLSQRLLHQLIILPFNESEQGKSFTSCIFIIRAKS